MNAIKSQNAQDTYDGKLVEDDELFWNLDKAAKYLGYTPRWMRELAKKGHFYPMKVGRRWLFKRSLIDQYIQEHNDAPET